MIEFIKNDAPLSGEIKGIDLNSKITLETSNMKNKGLLRPLILLKNFL